MAAQAGHCSKMEKTKKLALLPCFSSWTCQEFSYFSQISAEYDFVVATHRDIVINSGGLQLTLACAGKERE